MAYTVRELATLAGISVRTLHYYDEIGLLKPARVAENGYRQYEQQELLKLQQILFFRELDFSLGEIRRIMADPQFNIENALRDQRKLLELKRERLAKLIKTIDQTIMTVQGEIPMNEKEMYGHFTKTEMEAYKREAKQRWGANQSDEEFSARFQHYTQEDYNRMAKEGDSLFEEIVKHMEKGAQSREVQALIATHYDSLRAFYEPSLELYRGLANLYVDDERFAAYFKKYHAELPNFLRDAMIAYCDERE